MGDLLETHARVEQRGYGQLQSGIVACPRRPPGRGVASVMTGPDRAGLAARDAAQSDWHEGPTASSIALVPPSTGRHHMCMFDVPSGSNDPYDRDRFRENWPPDLGNLPKDPPAENYFTHPDPERFGADDPEDGLESGSPDIGDTHVEPREDVEAPYKPVGSSQTSMDPSQPYIDMKRSRSAESLQEIYGIALAVLAEPAGQRGPDDPDRILADDVVITCGHVDYQLTILSTGDEAQRRHAALTIVTVIESLRSDVEYRSRGAKPATNASGTHPPDGVSAPWLAKVLEKLEKVMGDIWPLICTQLTPKEWKFSGEVKTSALIFSGQLAVEITFGKS